MLMWLLGGCQPTTNDVLMLNQCSDSCPNGIAIYTAGGCDPARCECK